MSASSTQERQQKILESLRKDGAVRVSRLSEVFNVSEATIRRDLDLLHETGFLQRTHGGAVVANPALPEPPVIQRLSENTQAKERIGRAAANLIRDGETIFIGTGTTAHEVARNLCDRRNLTVITNSLLVINTLAQAENSSVIALGGLLRSSELSFIGYLTEQALRELHPQKVFIGIHAVSLRFGLSNDILPEVATDRVIIESAPEIVLVADNTKFDKVSTAIVAPLSVVSTVVTDDSTPTEIIAELREAEIEVIVA
jgi:DeoR/GlpR family transcriptional regulator of sugar metabolism